MNQYPQEHLPVENRVEMSTAEEKTERKEAQKHVETAL